MALVLLSTWTQDPISTHFLHFSSPSPDQETTLVSVFPSASTSISFLYSKPDSHAPEPCTVHLPASETGSLPNPRAANSSTATDNFHSVHDTVTGNTQFPAPETLFSSRSLHCLAEICSTSCYSRYLLCRQWCYFPVLPLCSRKRNIRFRGVMHHILTLASKKDELAVLCNQDTFLTIHSGAHSYVMGGHCLQHRTVLLRLQHLITLKL